MLVAVFKPSLDGPGRAHQRRSCSGHRQSTACCAHGTSSGQGSLAQQR